MEFQIYFLLLLIPFSIAQNCELIGATDGLPHFRNDNSTGEFQIWTYDESVESIEIQFSEVPKEDPLTLVETIPGQESILSFNDALSKYLVNEKKNDLEFTIVAKCVGSESKSYRYTIIISDVNNKHPEFEPTETNFDYPITWNKNVPINFDSVISAIDNDYESSNGDGAEFSVDDEEHFRIDTTKEFESSSFGPFKHSIKLYIDKIFQGSKTVRIISTDTKNGGSDFIDITVTLTGSSKPEFEAFGDGILEREIDLEDIGNFIETITASTLDPDFLITYSLTNYDEDYLQYNDQTNQLTFEFTEFDQDTEVKADLLASTDLGSRRLPIRFKIIVPQLSTTTELTTDTTTDESISTDSTITETTSTSESTSESTTTDEGTTTTIDYTTTISTTETIPSTTSTETTDSTITDSTTTEQTTTPETPETTTQFTCPTSVTCPVCPTETTTEYFSCPTLPTECPDCTTQVVTECPTQTTTEFYSTSMTECPICECSTSTMATECPTATTGVECPICPSTETTPSQTTETTTELSEMTCPTPTCPPSTCQTDPIDQTTDFTTPTPPPTCPPKTCPTPPEGTTCPICPSEPTTPITPPTCPPPNCPPQTPPPTFPPPSCDCDDESEDEGCSNGGLVAGVIVTSIIGVGAIGASIYLWILWRNLQPSKILSSFTIDHMSDKSSLVKSDYPVDTINSINSKHSQSNIAIENELFESNFEPEHIEIQQPIEEPLPEPDPDYVKRVRIQEEAIVINDEDETAQL